MMLPEAVAVTLVVIQALDALGVPYLIGGSLASAVYGVVRATADTDLVADLCPEHARPLAQALEGAFYLDVEAILDAIHRRSSFNLVHLETMFKVDVFVCRQRPFDQVQFERRVAHLVAAEPQRTAYIASAEDVVLAKLEWFRGGGEVSERQWRDVLGVLTVQGERLDQGYLRRWAAVLNVSDLLDRAWSEAEQGAEAAP